MEGKLPPPPPYEEISGAACGVSPSSSRVNQGFEGDEVILKPPSAPPLVCPSGPRITMPNVVRLKDEEIREACKDYISDHCCYGSRFLRDMILTDIQNKFAFHYKMESFGEKRESSRVYESFFGQSIDGPENGPEPDPWDVRVSVPTYFVDNQTAKEIPHTAYVKQCDKCVGNGKVRCDSCNGHGSESCSSCNGSGRRDDETCTWCSGSGNKTCFRCDGSGMVQCNKCHGHGNLKHFRQLIVTWKNHENNFVSDTWNLPKELVRESSGRQVMQEQSQQVAPLDHAPDASVNEASLALTRLHNTAFINELIIQQRHTLRAVPVTKVCWIWKDQHGEFYVHGFVKKVYFEDYPMKCGLCSLL